jgi:hypothetical protein
MRRWVTVVMMVALGLCGPAGAPALSVPSPPAEGGAAAGSGFRAALPPGECPAVEALAGGEGRPLRGSEAPFGFEACAGTQGILSYFQLGVVFPRLGSSALFLGVGARLASSLTWATFINMEDTTEMVSFHPVVATGVLSFGGSSPLLFGALRMYGGFGLHLGYTFTPYDSAIYGVGNLVGDNLTFAIVGYFGLELFTSRRLAVFMDAGGGYKSLFGDDGNPYAVASSWLGSGFGFRMGLRFYPLKA